MSASQDAATIALNGNFNQRCRMIAAQYAVNVVFVEDAGTANHTARVAFGQKVVTGTIAPDALAFVVLGDPSIQAAAIADLANMAAAVADVNIDGRLQAVWNALSLAGF